MLESFKWRLLSGSPLWGACAFLLVVLAGMAGGATVAEARSHRVYVTPEVVEAPIPTVYDELVALVGRMFKLTERVEAKRL